MIIDSICGVRESLVSEQATGLRPMVSNKVLILFTETMPGFSMQQWQDAVLDGFRRWATVANLSFDLASSESAGMAALQRKEAAYWRIKLHKFDGPFGVLADMMLPYGVGPQDMRFDTSERWYFGNNLPSGRIPLNLTAMHEAGHGICLPHMPVGHPPEVMEPQLNTSLLYPQPTESRLIVPIYGPPKNPVPDPTPKPDLLGDTNIALTIGKRVQSGSSDYLPINLEIRRPDGRFVAKGEAPRK